MTHGDKFYEENISRVKEMENVNVGGETLYDVVRVGLWIK